MNSAKIWEGESQFTDSTVMLYASCLKRPSANIKTGPAIQVGVMSKDVHPVEAAKTGKDEATCGSCRLRPSVHKEDKKKGEEVGEDPCYVKLFRKGAQWKSLKDKEAQPGVALEHISNARFVRFGEYGNMSAIPREEVEPILRAASNWTLYEHEWKVPINQWMRHFAMASVHSEEEAKEAQAMGWRTFRQTREGEKPTGQEVMCPFVTHGTQCIDCGLCNGIGPNGEREGVKSIANPSH